MNVEEVRLSTFEDWPSNAAVDPNRIAAAGFHCIGPELKCKCFSCGIEISDWQYGDQVMTRHRTMSPDCAFVRDPERAGNIPLVVQATRQQNGREQARQLGGSIGRYVSESSIYKSEQTRLDSFADWPIPFIVRPEALAATGFYFLQQGDKVCCAFCTGVINRWERGDIPKEEHRRHFPNCPFLLGLPVGNLPRTGHNSAESLCDPTRLAELGIHPHRGPRHPKFSTVEARFKTFSKWPSAAVQRPTDLSQAGFFHDSEQSTGSAQDQVRCFHCDGGLRNWEPVDTPWQEHARWFPTCPFLLLVKGQRFVDDIQNQFREGTIAAHLHSADPTKLPLPRGLSNLSSSMPSLSESERAEAGTSACAVGAAENLEEENRRLRDARQCKICMDAEIGTVLLPCGHLVACVGCAPSLLDCPVCRVTIKATIRTYLS